MLLVLMISLALISLSTNSMIAIPACFASCIRPLETLGSVPLPGRAIPTASHRQFILFAVYIPAQEPQPGQVLVSYSNSFASSIIFAFLAPTASNILDRLTSSLSTRPGIIAPPEQTTAGIFIRTAAITIPGTILSQLGTRTRPSSACAIVIVSTLSAISSRLARLYFMPACPIAIPSQTPMAGIMMGVPPAMRTPALTASVILSKLKCPGTISLCAETTPIKGLSSSSFVYPIA